MATRTQISELSRQKVTVIFGYSLFATAIMAVIISTVIPLGTILFSPHVKQLNVWMILIAFVAAAIVPFLVAYIIGDKATRAKSKVTHHYNGVLFGALAYWLSQLFVSIGALPFRAIWGTIDSVWAAPVANIWPILATIVVIAIVAVSYHSRKQKAGESVLQYTPYQLLLFGSVLISLVLSQQYITEGSQIIGGLLNIAVPLILIGISYTSIARVYPRKPARLVVAIVAVTFGYLAMQLAMELTYNVTYSVFLGIVATVIGVAVWVGYVRLSRKRQS